MNSILHKSPSFFIYRFSSSFEPQQQQGLLHCVGDVGLRKAAAIVYRVAPGPVDDRFLDSIRVLQGSAEVQHRQGDRGRR